MKQGWVVALWAALGVACGSDGSAKDAPGSAAPGGTNSASAGSGSPAPRPGGPGDTPLYVALGSYHGCAVTATGGVKCWGLMNEGQLGNGKATPADAPVPAPVDVTGLDSGMIAVAAGGQHSCALAKGGGVKCWGDNGYGQLGNDSVQDSSVPVDVVGLADVVEVQAGYGHTCARRADGALLCWGSNSWGELGDGTGSMSRSTDAKTPREVPGLGPVRSFDLGQDTTCAVTQGGSAMCWGNNRDGQLGTGTTEDALTPVQVVGLETGVVQISVGSSFACAVTDQGNAKCWGSNTSGQLGNGKTERSLVPVEVNDLADASLIQAGYVHTCALRADASVKCWGGDSNGQLGAHTGANNASMPGPGLSGVTQLSTNGSTNCAVLSSPSTIQCWGFNGYGELGNDGGSYSRKPRALPGF